MRTTNEIVCAVKDCQPVTEEELRLALVALSAIDLFTRRDCGELVDQILAPCNEPGLRLRAARLRAHGAKRALEDSFQALKTAPDKYLGPCHMPGTPEHAAGMRVAKAVFKKATGVDLDAQKGGGE